MTKEKRKLLQRILKTNGDKPEWQKQGSERMVVKGVRATH